MGDKPNRDDEPDHNSGSGACVDCSDDPVRSLVSMFVGMVQKGRIQKGQCPAMRPVFLKPHGVSYGVFRVRKDIPDWARVGLFAGSEYPIWARFSSDTLPTVGDFKTTIGIGLKLFDTPTPKIFGLPDDTTFDFIMQNMDVFFVDTAKDMCEFTKAGVVDGNYDSYLRAHPKTKKILDEMAKPVASCLTSPYWAILPFALGKEFVKYKLEPTITARPPATAPADPTYLARDLETRLDQGEAVFRFCIQRRTDPASMPLDEATVPWSEEKSPFIHIADVIFPRQDIRARGQQTYGEHLSWNIWRVTKAHEPQGSIAAARKVVYAASADERRDVNGIPTGEPIEARPPGDAPPCVDDEIVRASIHPAIGVARVGDAETAYFIGPEVTTPPSESPGFYRTPEETLKRQAARFRVYGYNAAGEVVRELTASNAMVTWTVHVANRKADWFRFITAMDIPETRKLELVRRNAAITGTGRESLVIDPGPRSISGVSVAGGTGHRFDTGEFKGVKVPLGELQTDDQGRLLFLGGHGKSASPSGAPPFDPSEPDTFNNADDWYDDMSDGPVTAEVSIDGRIIPCEGAWVICAPPNYAPDLVSWRTMYDLMVDTFVACGELPVPETTSFVVDVLPQLQRFSRLQWVNAGMAAMFGKGRPMDFEDPAFIARLGQGPSSSGADPYQELRRNLFNAFRTANPKVNEPRLWPWEYGDDFGGDLFQKSPRTMLIPPTLQLLHLQRWVDGTFISDWNPSKVPPRSLDVVPLQEQPAMLDQAAMHFCLADAFHPGCEMTWPMRHASMYASPFRIRHRESSEPANEYGSTLNQQQALAPDGPLYAQGPGDITQWMGLPWQGDTGYCRSGYDPDYDPYLPTFWPARVPNTVVTEEDYEVVVDDSRPREERVAAYNRRVSWNRFMDQAPTIPARMERLIATFGQQGIIEARPGVLDDPDFPEVIYVENLPPGIDSSLRKAALLLAAPAPDETLDPRSARIRAAGWGDEQHLADARRMRRREKA